MNRNLFRLIQNQNRNELARPRRLLLLAAQSLAATFAPLLASPAVAAPIPGTLVAWGDQAFPYLGPETRFAKVAAGYFHSLALKPDGTVIAWGSNDSGRSTVPEGLRSVVAIA